MCTSRAPLQVGRIISGGWHGRQPLPQLNVFAAVGTLFGDANPAAPTFPCCLKMPCSPWQPSHFVCVAKQDKTALHLNMLETDDEPIYLGKNIGSKGSHDSLPRRTNDSLHRANTASGTLGDAGLSRCRRRPKPKPKSPRSLMIPYELRNKYVELGRAKTSEEKRRRPAVFGFFDGAGRFCRRLGRGVPDSLMDLPSSVPIAHDKIAYRPLFAGLSHKQVRTEKIWFRFGTRRNMTNFFDQTAGSWTLECCCPSQAWGVLSSVLIQGDKMHNYFSKCLHHFLIMLKGSNVGKGMGIWAIGTADAHPSAAQSSQRECLQTEPSMKAKVLQNAPPEKHLKLPVFSPPFSRCLPSQPYPSRRTVAQVQRKKRGSHDAQREGICGTSRRATQMMLGGVCRIFLSLLDRGLASPEEAHSRKRLPLCQVKEMTYSSHVITFVRSSSRPFFLVLSSRWGPRPSSGCRPEEVNLGLLVVPGGFIDGAAGHDAVGVRTLSSESLTFLRTSYHEGPERSSTTRSRGSGGAALSSKQTKQRVLRMLLEKAVGKSGTRSDKSTQLTYVFLLNSRTSNTPCLAMRIPSMGRCLGRNELTCYRQDSVEKMTKSQNLHCQTADAALAATGKWSF
ncbi:hypothetical protein HRG_014351 [Hirsutella rhossiliensis]